MVFTIPVAIFITVSITISVGISTSTIFMIVRTSTSVFIAPRTAWSVVWTNWILIVWIPFTVPTSIATIFISVSSISISVAVSEKNYREPNESVSHIIKILTYLHLVLDTWMDTYHHLTKVDSKDIYLYLVEDIFLGIDQDICYPDIYHDTHL